MMKRPLPTGTRIGGYVISGIDAEFPHGIRYLAQNPASANGARTIRLLEYFPDKIAERRGNTIRSFSDFSAFSTFEAGLKRFVEMAGRASLARETSLVSIIECVEENGTAYLVSELPEGNTFRDTVALRGAFSPSWAVSFVSMIVPGLAVLEAAGLMHGEISPDTLIQLNDGYPVLDVSSQYLEYGAANLEQAERLNPLYGAPELLDAKFDEPVRKADMFSLAAVIWFMVTGQDPLPTLVEQAGPSSGPLLPSSIRDQLDAERVEALLKAGLTRAPDDRPANSREWMKLAQERRARKSSGMFGSLRLPVGITSGLRRVGNS